MAYNFTPSPCTNYKKFVLINQVFDDAECDKILSYFVNPKVAAIRPENVVDISYRNSRVVWLHPQETNLWMYQRIETVMLEANRHHWNFQLSRIDATQLTEYSEKGHYGWHEDHGPGVHCIRKLSMVIQLTKEEEYEGGGLLLFPNDMASRSRGSAIIFPSFVTHKVEPVTKGKRMSLVTWAEGSAFI